MSSFIPGKSGVLDKLGLSGKGSGTKVPDPFFIWCFSLCLSEKENKMKMRTRRRYALGLAGLALILALGLGACSSSGDNPTGPGGQASTPLKMTTIAPVNGAVDVHVLEQRRGDCARCCRTTRRNPNWTPRPLWSCHPASVTNWSKKRPAPASRSSRPSLVLRLWLSNWHLT